MTKPAIKITAALGAFILLITAAFHMTGLSDVRASVTGVERELFRDGLPGIGYLWLFYRSDYRAINLIHARLFSLLSGSGCWSTPS